MGDPELRELVLERVRTADGLTALSEPTIDQVIVTAGSNELLYLIGETLLDPGDIVLCAAPTYFVYLGGLANLGARSIGVAVDEDGIIPEALQEAFETRRSAGDLHRVKAIYVCSYYENPSSITLSAARRQEIVELARRYSQNEPIYVIEDSAYRELRYYGEDIPSLLAADEEGGQVIHTGSFSKSFSPGLRVGWGILPTALVEPICNQKGNIDFGAPHFSQQVVAAALKLGLFDQHVHALRDSYRKKLEAMLDACEQHLGSVPGARWIRATGGLYVWLQLEDIDSGSGGPLFRRALDEGMLYVPGIHCYPQEGQPPRHDMIRLSFGVQPPARIREGIGALARAVLEVLPSASASPPSPVR
jgi:2-aminoadipate transaminase